MQLVSVPMYGILSRSRELGEQQELGEYSSFTMDDINALRIRLEALGPRAADAPLLTLCLHCSACCFAAIHSDRVIQVCFLAVNQRDSTHKRRIRLNYRPPLLHHC